MAQPSTVRVLVVDDFQPFRSFIISMLSEHPHLHIVGEAEDGFDAVRKAAELNPNLVLLDISLPGQSGLAVARQILNASPEIKIISVTADASPEVARTVLDVGIHGYVVKARIIVDLIPAIETVLRGETFVSGVLALDTGRKRKQKRPAKQCC
jgi:DNA-binding NarL/FixJ family response regulator